MIARFSVNVVRGSFNEMTISWPDYEADGWQILDGYTKLITDAGTTNLAPPSDGDKVTVQFLQRQSRQFVIEIQALRDLKTFQESDGLLFLPDIATPTPHTTTVSLVESDAHSMVLSTQDGQNSFPQLPRSRWPGWLTEREEPLTAWLVDSTRDEVKLEVKQQQSEVRASLQAEVSVVNDTIHVSETVSYDVRHRDIREVRLLVGDAAPKVRLRGVDEPLQALSVDDGVVTYGLSKAMRGDFELLIDYYVAPAAGAIDSEGGLIELPLVLPSSADETIDSIQVATNMPDSIVLTRSDDWVRIHSDQFSAAWSTATIPQSLPMQLKHTLQSDARRKPHLLIAKSALISENFVTSLTAVYSDTVDIAAFSVPSGCRLLGATIGGQDALSDVVADESGNQIIQIRPRRAAEPRGQTVTLVVQQNVPDSLNLFATFQPSLPRPVGAESDCNCVWVLRQAVDSSLFHWSGSMSELARPFSLTLSSEHSETQTAAMVDVLSPGGGALRSEVMRLLNQSLKEPERHQLLVGSSPGKSQKLVVISRRALLLATAIIGLLMYFAITRLHALALTTLVVTAAAFVTTMFAMIPGPAHMILLRLIPGCVIAIIAATLQRWFSTEPAAVLRNIASEDGSTIFTIDQPVQSQAVSNPV